MTVIKAGKYSGAIQLYRRGIQYEKNYITNFNNL